MKTSILTLPVNTGDTTGDEPVEITFSLPRWAWEAIKAESIRELVTTDEVVTAVFADFYGRYGKLPVMLHERTARFVRECCDTAGVDPDEWVEGWICNSLVAPALDGSSDVNSAGMCYDLAEEEDGPDGEPRTAAEKEALYEKFREVAFRYQQEVKGEPRTPATVVQFPKGPATGTRGDLVKLYVPLWLRERIRATATAIQSDLTGKSTGDGEEQLLRYVVEQIGGDYLVRHGAAAFHENLINEWVLEKDRSIFRAGFADLRDRWGAEEAEQPLGQPKIQRAASAMDGGAL